MPGWRACSVIRRVMSLPPKHLHHPRSRARPGPTAASSSETGSTLHTDEHGGYVGLEGLFYAHERINHSAGEYVRDGVTTNGIESVWAVMKRGLHGVYHHASPKHLDRYVAEFTFRLNDGAVQRHTLDRLASMFSAAIGQRLTYKDLIA